MQRVVNTSLDDRCQSIFREYSSHKPRHQKHPDHNKRHGDAGGDADGHADPDSESGGAGGLEVFVRVEFAEDCSDEGADDDSGQAEKEADHGADCCADDAVFACAETFCAEKSGEEVDEVCGGGERGEDRDGAPADVGEVFRPGGEDEAREDQQHAGQCRHDKPRETGDKHERGGYPEYGVGVHVQRF